MRTQMINELILSEWWLFALYEPLSLTMHVQSRNAASGFSERPRWNLTEGLNWGINRGIELAFWIQCTSMADVSSIRDKDICFSVAVSVHTSTPNLKGLVKSKKFTSWVEWIRWDLDVNCRRTQANNDWSSCHDAAQTTVYHGVCSLFFGRCSFRLSWDYIHFWAGMPSLS